MMNFNTLARVILCLGVLILERESHNMISPILSEWDWIHNTLYTNNTSDGSIQNSQNMTLISHLFDTESQSIHITAIVVFLVTPVVSFTFAPLSGYIADTIGYETSLLRGYCTPCQFLNCFCIFLKNYSTLVTSKICFL